MTATGRSAATTASRVDALTGIRFVGMTFVFVAHANGTLVPAHVRPWLAPVAAPARIWVSFFFLLSGFVLCWSGSDRGGAKAFYVRRLARIYPSYALVRLAGLLVVLAGTGFSLAKVGLAAFLLQSWVPHAPFYFSVPGVSWSLSVEAFLYLCFPLVVVALRRATPMQRRWIAAGCLLVPVVLSGLAQAGYRGHDYVNLNDSVGVWLACYLPLARLPEFALGVLVALSLRERGRAPVPLRVAAPLFFAGYAYAMFWPSMLTQHALTVGPLALLLAAVTEREAQGGVRWLRTPRMVALGDASYCFYLTHTLTVLVLMQLPLMHSVPGAVLAYGVGLVVAIALHRLVEVPANRAVLRRWKARRQRVVVVASALAD